MKIYKSIAIFLFLFLLATSVPTLANEEVDRQRQLIMDQKKLVVLHSMQFSDQESSAFWPVYDQYQDALFKVNQKIDKMIVDFVKAYNTLSDEKAQNIIREYLEIEKERLQLKTSFAKKFTKVLPPRKVMRYLQIENKLEAIEMFDLAWEIPLAK